MEGADHLKQYKALELETPKSVPGSVLNRRYQLVAELITFSSERFLRAYAAFSAFVMLVGVIYAIYALAVLVFASPQAGWFSTAIVQAMSITFVAGAFVVLCLGMMLMVQRQVKRDGFTILHEQSNLDFFKHTTALNVVDEDSSQGLKQ